MHKDARNGGPVSLEPIAARAESFDVMRWARELAGEPARSEALAGHSVEKRQCAQAKRREDGERGVGSTGASCVERLRRHRTSAWGQCATHTTRPGLWRTAEVPILRQKEQHGGIFRPKACRPSSKPAAW